MITVTWRESGAPCDSCGKYERNQTVTFALTNEKYVEYKLPDLTICATCRSPFRHEIAAHTPL